MEDKMQKEVFKEVFSSTKEWGWFLVLGILFVILGIAALAMPVMSTVGLTLGLAGVLVVMGIIQFANAVKLRHYHGDAMRFFQAIVSLVVGGLMFRYPGEGMLGVAFALSFYFFISGAIQWIISYTRKPEPGWRWGLFGSALSFILGVYIILTFPFSALWVPGTLLGIELIFSGSALIALSIGGRKPTPRGQDIPLKTSKAM